MGAKLWTNPEGEKAVICQGDGCSCKRHSARPVQRVDGETGEVLEEYCSVKVASVHLNLSPSSCSGISAVCRGQQRSTGGHVYQYKFQHHCNSNGVSKPVLQLDKNDNIIAEFDSVTEASNICGVSRTVLRSVCNGYQQQTCDGLRFKYKYDGDQVGSIDDEEEEEEDEEDETEDNEEEEEDDLEAIPFVCQGDGCSCKGSRARPVQRVDEETGEVLEEYCSGKVASVHLSIRNGVSHVCIGRQRSARAERGGGVAPELGHPAARGVGVLPGLRRRRRAVRHL